MAQTFNNLKFVIDNKRIVKVSDMLVARTLATDYANPYGIIMFGRDKLPQSMAERCRMTPQQVDESLLNLEKLGVIFVYRKKATEEKPRPDGQVLMVNGRSPQDIMADFARQVEIILGRKPIFD